MSSKELSLYLCQIQTHTVYSMCRRKKNREAASELLMRLKDNRDLQKFLQDCQEVNHPYTRFTAVERVQNHSLDPSILNYNI